MNKVKKKVYRNTPAFTLMAWASFCFFVALILIGLYTLKEPLMVKGYYLMGSVGLISSSFTVSKVVRDNQEDEDNYNHLLQQAAYNTEEEK
ncbi:TPA: YiaA/YiaB family inner membrane protein [Streptococcus suis]